MGLEMVRIGSKQKNIYIELNEVGLKRISARPYKIEFRSQWNNLDKI